MYWTLEDVAGKSWGTDPQESRFCETDNEQWEILSGLLLNKIMSFQANTYQRHSRRKKQWMNAVKRISGLSLNTNSVILNTNNTTKSRSMPLLHCCDRTWLKEPEKSFPVACNVNTFKQHKFQLVRFWEESCGIGFGHEINIGLMDTSHVAQTSTPIYSSPLKNQYKNLLSARKHSDLE